MSSSCSAATSATSCTARRPLGPRGRPRHSLSVTAPSSSTSLRCPAPPPARAAARRVTPSLSLAPVSFAVGCCRSRGAGAVVVPDVDALQALTVELGREFLRRGWQRRLPSLRVYLLALRHGRFVTIEWTPELLHRIASVVGLGPAPLPHAERCPRCPPPSPGVWSGTRTSLYLENLWVSACSECSSEWVQTEAPSRR